ncbi:hypothetical protein [Nonlabens sp. Asnod3-A02]|uniref:hypothetical protein n=1 Tax=Nonlabens sp. Asnod3-A02 TaxID=3160579 RepID=UPI0038708D0E
MKKICFQILQLAFYGILCLIIIGCNEKPENTTLQKSEIEYEFEREIITYDYGNGITEDVELYIGKSNDTIGNQVFAYNKKVLDSSMSLFYELNLKQIKNSNEYSGLIKYHFNPNREGKLVSFTFTVISKINDKTDFLNFYNYDNEKNQLEFKLKNNSDTLVGHIHAQHTLDSIVNNEDKIRIREIFISVDNYTKTNNPFTKGLR